MIYFFNFTKFNQIGSIIIIFFFYYSGSGTSCATTFHKQPPPIISQLFKTLKFPNPSPMVETSPKQPPLVIAHFTVTGGNEAGVDLASHASIFRGARISSLPTNACSTEDNIPFPSLANHIVLSLFWKVDLDCRVTR